jgi:hypothetical protein
MVGKSTHYYNTHPAAKAKKDAYNTEYHATPARRKYRADLDKNRRARERAGQDLTGKDVSHTAGGGTTLEDSSTNRARNRGTK